MEDQSPKIVHLLDRLEAELPAMSAQFEKDEDLLAAFKVEADAIRALAGQFDRAYVEGRINCMLKNAHLIPGEDEGEPCN